MKKTQVQGVHHITIVGSTKQSAVDFWQGVLGMPFIFEQPNLGKPDALQDGNMKTSRALSAVATVLGALSSGCSTTRSARVGPSSAGIAPRWFWSRTHPPGGRLKVS